MTRTSIASAIVGAGLLVGAPVGWYLGQPAGSVGLVPIEAADHGSTAPSAPPGSAPATPRQRGSDPAATAARPQPEPDPESDPTLSPAPEVIEPPVGIAIPAIGIDAEVVRVGLEPDRSMEIPADVSTVGWYEPGVLPGGSGTAVMAGHVDSRTQGRGAFFDLRRLDVDDVVTVDHADGTSSEWRVTARTAYPKDELPISEIFTRFSDTRLVLITCGGAFDSDTRHYTENIVVFTVPVDAAAA